MVGTIYLHYSGWACAPAPCTPGSGVPVTALLLLGNELWSLPFRMLQNLKKRSNSSTFVYYLFSVTDKTYQTYRLRKKLLVEQTKNTEQRRLE